MDGSGKTDWGEGLFKVTKDGVVCCGIELKGRLSVNREGGGKDKMV